MVSGRGGQRWWGCWILLGRHETAIESKKQRGAPSTGQSQGLASEWGVLILEWTVLLSLE